jgi:hypothetical protein
MENDLEKRVDGLGIVHNAGHSSYELDADVRELLAFVEKEKEKSFEEGYIKGERMFRKNIMQRAFEQAKEWRKKGYKSLKE